MVVDGIERTGGARRVGRVTLGQLLGTGAHSTVWMGQADHLAEPVAVKILADRWAEVPEIRRDFVAAGHWLRQLAGEGLIEVLGSGELEDGRPYVVLALAEHGSLEARLRQGPLPVSEAIRIGIAVAETLVTLHDRGVTHGNLTPAKVLFASVGDDAQRIVLTDPVPPGSADVAEPDPRSDVHATGALLLAMVTGRRMRVPGAVTDRARLPRTECRGFDALVGRTLAPNHATRPADCRELAAALRRLVDEDGSTLDRARAGTLATSDWRLIAGGRRSLGWLVGACLLVVAAGWVTGSRLFPDRSVEVVLTSADLAVTLPVRAGDRVETSDRVLGNSIEVAGVGAGPTDASSGAGSRARAVFVGSAAAIANSDLGGATYRIDCAERSTEPWTAPPGSDLPLSGFITTSTSCASGVDYLEATVSSPSSGHLVYAVVEDGTRADLVAVLDSLRRADD